MNELGPKDSNSDCQPQEAGQWIDGPDYKAHFPREIGKTVVEYHTPDAEANTAFPDIPFTGMQT
jgi:hypothetical protein